MYPGTIFNWHDQSEIKTVTNVTNVDDSPLLLQVFSSDKGTEDMIEVSGSDFKAMYGEMDFAKHGQSAIQAAAIVEAGGRLLAKRVVATDSTLASVVFVANVTVIPHDDEPAVPDIAKVKWTTQTITGCKTFEEINAQALALLDEDQGVYPLIVVTDNGRGKSLKAVRFNPDYATSKTIGKMFYTLGVYEGTSITEQKAVSLDPTVVYNNNAYRLDRYTCTQVVGEVNETVFDKYVEKLVATLLIETDVLRNYDLIYGYTNTGAPIPNFELDSESVDLDQTNGVELAGGVNGAFGNTPCKTDAWTTAIAEFFSGTDPIVGERVWDVDQYKVAAVCDANYPDLVKNAIADWTNFRQDCVFFRDYGLGLKTFLEIKAKYDSFATKRSCFIMDYCTNYQIKDPISKKNIEVTMTYDLAPILVTHIANNTFAPMAGFINGFILKNPIKGSINFTPINTPTINQKEAMEEIRVNYAIFEEDNCVVQSCYTSQDKYTQLSYGNNVIAIQRVLRAVRTACPKQRYSFFARQAL